MLGMPLILPEYPNGLPENRPPHSGAWAAWLGREHHELAFIAQTMIVPTEAPHLAFWSWIVSEDACGYDFAMVIVNSADTVDQFDLCAAANTGEWLQRSVDLSPYAGQQVLIQIQVDTDGSLRSNLFLDDFSFQRAP